MSEPVITAAQITETKSDKPLSMNTIFDAMPKVIATFSDGREIELFSYYPDEISFTPDEFIGLTERQARKLRHDKDVRYLQS
jgi:hypothetical protein